MCNQRKTKAIKLLKSQTQFWKLESMKVLRIASLHQSSGNLILIAKVQTFVKSQAHSGNLSLSTKVPKLVESQASAVLEPC